MMEEAMGPGFQAVTSPHLGADRISSPRGRSGKGLGEDQDLYSGSVPVGWKTSYFPIFSHAKWGQGWGFPFWMVVLALGSEKFPLFSDSTVHAHPLSQGRGTDSEVLASMHVVPMLLDQGNVSS